MLYLLRFSEIAVLRAAALCAGAGYWYGPKPPDKSGFLLAKKEPPSICCGGAEAVYLRTKTMPIVPGPQWQEMVQPAVVS